MAKMGSLFILKVPTNYDFVYSVNDPYSGDDHAHTEKKTEGLTEGQYRVRLPDGRTQIVTYTADDGGYHAKVEYQGEAHHEHHHQYSHLTHNVRNITHDQPESLHESPDKIYKYSPTPYPAGPKVFRPKAPLYYTKPTYHKIHQLNHDT